MTIAEDPDAVVFAEAERIRGDLAGEASPAVVAGAAPDARTGIALLRASLANDTAGQAAILNTVDPVALSAVVVGMALVLGGKLYGSLEAFNDHLGRCLATGELT